MINKIISGGQTGADQAALDVANHLQFVIAFVIALSTCSTENGESAFR
jgi:hypothetical protein